MAHLHNFQSNQNPSRFEGIGSKLKYTAEIAGAIKTIFDIGRSIYTTVGPGLALAAFA